ncbi:hypothetical protein CEUSTIGMA_g602.t1 [Chlamydomonas eustigma]|uniref:SET domain-containing protein n=1 Tax=Chlamydomonas eustigma TaxID=1157962 RepID=A0A250WR27_9CHLO|nr:hypothetical protein CEUSTIGMA_g602.t1 [Chlamydomonas eustigma]|eukprot:GAX73149.1 hypothetical protein CEUSTIGMA_g602.t1 [Chlamydomonas eustigma]
MVLTFSQAPARASQDLIDNFQDLVATSVSQASNSVQISSVSLCMSAALLVAIIIEVYKNRPRGWARNDLVQIATSQVAGKGLFAKRDIPSSTVLGAYPGLPRDSYDMGLKAHRCPQVEQYVFTTGSGVYLDPTDASGEAPSPYPSPGLMWPFPTQIALAFVNEPPEGSCGPNCSIEDGGQDDREILFVTSRDIAEGEEILIDYGQFYNRNGYDTSGL